MKHTISSRKIKYKYAHTQRQLMILTFFYTKDSKEKDILPHL